MFNFRMKEAIDHGCNCNGGDVLYTELETVIHREASSAVAICCSENTIHQLPYFACRY